MSDRSAIVVFVINFDRKFQIVKQVDYQLDPMIFTEKI